MKQLVITVTLLAMLGSVAHAKHRPVTPTKPLSFSQAVDACRAWIRTHGEPAFDAFARPDDQVEFRGTDAARFTFKKCMNANGQTLDSIPPATATAPPPAATPLPASYGPRFLAACEKYGSHALCTCGWAKMQQRFSVEQMIAMENAKDYSPLAPINAECQREIDANTF
jgi:hypothetical protein